MTNLIYLKNPNGYCDAEKVIEESGFYKVSSVLNDNIFVKDGKSYGFWKWGSDKRKTKLTDVILKLKNFNN